MSLLELIARADERALAASGVACLDRCLPLPDEDGDPEPLRPLWAGSGTGLRWAERLAAVREALDHEEAGEREPAIDGTAVRIRKALADAPSTWTAGPLREWADACSLLALEIHLELDTPVRATGPDGGAVSDGPDDAAGSGVGEAGTALLERCRAGATDGSGPLLAGELLRQIQILEALTATSGTAAGGGGLRQVLDLSTEGRRVLRAVMSRRARGRG
ncbi:hypothetical protein PZB75_20395 [Streptomyces sp. AM 4-1-1]|uniref:hypothetical protein n=1 Tax=Streptomyces sp. AM 4-1-1 TaxID=3028710 RepID=UPI0023B9E43C|nr:hypothetical protein [Streptomyces sp. AM 4-1-1]WEH35503.1 hypothetical protein PZB75_20395 [Streptomyces sp. AM 4-1-1]